MKDTRAEYDSLLSVYLWVGGAACALVIGAFVVLAVRYRARRPGRPDQAVTAPRVELAYVAVLAALAVALVVMTFRTDDRTTARAAEPGALIQVTAFKWQWEFRYPRLGRSEVGGPDRAARLVVPTGTPVRFEITSRDVVHSFYIPELRFKRDAFPDHVNRVDLTFSEPGRRPGHCAEFCGLDHAEMGFDVIALEPAAFQEWARTGRVPA